MLLYMTSQYLTMEVVAVWSSMIKASKIRLGR